MKRIPYLLAAVTMIVAVIAVSATAQTPTNENHYTFWCGTDGEKVDPAATPYIVPEPDAGRTWWKLVLKAASGDNQNFEVLNPIPGVGYSHPSGHNNSHAILCWNEGSTPSTTTTTPSITTTGPTNTTTSEPSTPTSTVTTEPPTTTTAPVTTTSLNTTTSTVVATTTTISATTSTSEASMSTTSTVPLTTPTTTIPEVETDIPDDELPGTG